MSDADRFMKRFIEVWQDPKPQSFRELFTDDGRLFHPTMAAPIAVNEIPAYVSRMKEAVPDISLTVKNWATRGDVVLLEWEITGTFDGEPISWSGADRFTLQGDRIVDGVAFFDTLPLWARLDSTMSRPPLDEFVQAALA